MKIKLQHKMINFLNLLPKRVLLIPYDLSFWLVKLYLKSGCRFVFLKNGIKSRLVTPGVSDVDLCLIVENSRERTLILPRIERAEKFLPVLGEVSVLDVRNLPVFASLMNFDELRRNPDLQYYLSSQGLPMPRPTKASQFVFLSRMLISDKENLSKWPDLRIQKWKAHLQDKNVREIQKGEDIFPAVVEDYLSPLISKDLRDFFYSFINENPCTSDELHSFYQRYLGTNIYPLVAMVQWLGSSLWFNRLESDIKELQGEREIYNEILLEQIKWELWGLYSQLHTVKRLPNIQEHLSKIEMVLKRQPAMYKTEVEKCLKALETLQFEISHSYQTPH